MSNLKWVLIIVCKCVFNVRFQPGGTLMLKNLASKEFDILYFQWKVFTMLNLYICLLVPISSKLNYSVSTTKVKQLLYRQIFSPPTCYPLSSCQTFLASHFPTNWISWLRLGNQVDSTSDHLSLFPTQHTERLTHDEGRADRIVFTGRYL